MMLTTGGRRRVDLGRLNPACTARWHGTVPAYKGAGCRCPHAREAHRIYQKRMREGRNRPVLVDATGTRRRVQALWALGHTSQVIADTAGGVFDRDQVKRFCYQDLVTPVHHAAIVSVYQVLMNRQGRSSRTRLRALAASCALPVQWGSDIDDPAAVPDPLEPEQAVPAVVDEVAVESALAGRKVSLNDHELVAAVRAGVGRGLGNEAVAQRLHIDFRAVRTIGAGVVPPRLGALVRRRLATVGAL